MSTAARLGASAWLPAWIAAALAFTSSATWSAEQTQAEPLEQLVPPATTYDPGPERTRIFINEKIESLRGVNTAFFSGWTPPPIMEQRFVPATNRADVVDLNVIPLNLLARMDVVTGGIGVSYGTGAASAPVQRIISCNFTMQAWGRAGWALIDTWGGRTSLPFRAEDTLTGCSSTGTGDEVLLVFRRMKGEQPWHFARVVDSSGKLLAETELDRAGTVEFTVAGKQYQAQVPAP